MSNSFLAIRLSSLGDVAMLVPVFLHLNKAYPSLRIVLVTRKQFVPLFRQLDFVETIAINPENNKIRWVDILILIYRLRNYEFKNVLDFHGVIRTHIMTTYYRFLGKNISIIFKDREGRKELIKPISKTLKPLKSVMENYSDVIRQAGYPFVFGPNIFLPVVKKMKASEEHWIGISPFSKHDSKSYSLVKLNKIIESLVSYPSVRCFIFGFGNEEKFKAEFNFGNHPQIIFLINRISFEEELSYISNLDCMLSMDSGNGHIASNYGIPVITLWGTTHPALGFAPYGQSEKNWFFPNPETFPFLPVSVFGNYKASDYINAINSISESAVIHRVKYLLNL